MSLATTCPACGTCFRVVQDQLKVSEGWVRCGHCHDVFNALEGLFELEPAAQPAPAPVPPPSAASDTDWATRTQPLDASSRAALNTVGAASDALAHDVEAAPPAQAAETTDTVETAPAPEPTIEVVASGAEESDGILIAADEETSAGAWPALVDDPSPPAQAIPPDEPEPEAAGAADASAGPEAPGDAAPSDNVAAFQPPDDADEPPEVLGSAMDESPDRALQGEVASSLDAGAATGFVVPAEPAASVAQFLVEERPASDEMPGEAAPADPALPGLPAAAASLAEPEAAEANPAAAVVPALPGFVQRAEKQARWSRPGRRLLMGSLCMVLGLGIVAQVAWHGRERLAYAWPALQPVLSQACRELGCTLQAPHVIDALVVDNTTLTHPPGFDGYRLTVTLHNRAEHPVAAPHLMLELTDSDGTLLVRRVLAPTDFGSVKAQAIRPQGDTTWSLDFTTERRMSGYTVAVFYP